MIILYTQVYRYGSPSPLPHCAIFGDPHITTFEKPEYLDNYYSTYLTGNFIYATNTSEGKFEVSFYFHSQSFISKIIERVISLD